MTVSKPLSMDDLGVKDNSSRAAPDGNLEAVTEAAARQGLIDQLPATWAAIDRATTTPGQAQSLTDAERVAIGHPRLLDLFCCEGGASVGYDRAGFLPVGVDIKHKRRYPYEFIQHDVLALDPAWIARNFDAVHASPICQGLTRMRAPGKKQHPNLIPATVALLEATGLPWVLENVEGAEPWMPDAITLCGTMFGLGTQGFELQRHRLFIANFPISPPGPCRHEKPVVGVYGGHARNRSAKHGGRGTRDVWEGGHVAACSEAMGMDWATLDGMSEAIPPAYTEWLGAQLMAQTRQREAA